MICPSCENLLEHDATTCLNCNFNLSTCNWVVIRKVYPPNDIIIEGLLKSLGFPVRLIHESIGTLYGFTQGPLAEVAIAVPEICSQKAIKLLAAELVR